MTALEELIRAEIRATGPMRFERFMELALYHPGLGYYANPGEGRAIGRGGDFYTSVSVGPLFGRLLARQFHQMWGNLGNPQPFWIIEQGGHDGRLARDILEWCRDETPDFFGSLRYGIVHSAHGASALPTHLAGFESHVQSFADLDTLAAIQPRGVFFSNELLDAFPVRAIVRRKGDWLERHVGLEHDRLAWTEGPVDDELARAIKTLPLPEIDGYATEINLRARAWMSAVARALAGGYVVTVDYGYVESVYYESLRARGTLRAYVKHRVVDDVLAEPGGRDLTAHVDFTALVRSGRGAGLEPIGFLDQQRFLTGIAYDELSGADVPRTKIAENLRAWHTLTHPEFLGSRFHVLVQAKDAKGDLDGLRYRGDMSPFVP